MDSEPESLGNPFVIACSTFFSEGIVERLKCLTSSFRLIVEVMLDPRLDHLHPFMSPKLINGSLRDRKTRISEHADWYRHNILKAFVLIKNGRAAGGAEETCCGPSTLASPFPLVVGTINGNELLAEPSLDTECAASAPLTFQAMANRHPQRVALATDYKTSASTLRNTHVAASEVLAAAAQLLN